MESELYRYMVGIASNKNHKILLINGHKDHVHILLSISPTVALSEIIRDLKNNSSKFINEQNILRYKFYWQEGYGAFSCSSSQLNKIYQYIKNQKEHHREQRFQEEYISFLKLNGIKYDERYI